MIIYLNPVACVCLHVAAQTADSDTTLLQFYGIKLLILTQERRLPE